MRNWGCVRLSKLSDPRALAVRAGLLAPLPASLVTAKIRRQLRAVIASVLRRRRRDVDAFVAHELTKSGRSKKRWLASLGRATEGEDYELVDVDPAENSLRFARKDGSADLTVEVHRKRSQQYAATRHFGISHRGTALSDGGRAFLDSLAQEVRRWEARLIGEPGFPQELLDPSPVELSYYPSDLRLELRPTLACNHSCRFCNSPAGAFAENTARGIPSLIDSIPLWNALPIAEVAISGGEPTLLAGLPDLVQALAKAGYHVELQTNGMAFADEAYAVDLRRCGLREVLVSLHSARSEHSDTAITRFARGWQRTVEGIDRCLAAGIRVDISHVIHADNYRETSDFLRFVLQRWGRRVGVRLAYTAPTGAARAAYAELAPPLPEVVPHLRKGLAFADARGLPVIVVGYCGVPPCLLTPFEHLTDVANRSATSFPDSHTRLPECTGCRYEGSCPGLWRKYLEVHGNPGVRRVPWRKRAWSR